VEALAAARFRRPGAALPPAPSSKRAYQRVAIPTLVIEAPATSCYRPLGERNRQPASAGPIGRHRGAGHCPQLEQPSDTNALL